MQDKEGKMKKILLPPRVVRYSIKPEGYFPNNAELPVLIYKHVFGLPELPFRAASVIEKIFHDNNWKNSWRDSIYDFHHYHSTTHEVLGAFRGRGKILLGGPKGIITELEKGDVIIIPVGVSHKLVSDDHFRCVGAYPNGMDWDVNYGKPEELEITLKNIERVPLPSTDPVFGSEGPFWEHWWYHTKLWRGQGVRASKTREKK
jgi:uncharacterized protein YjlB